ncbi:hypothetical protein IU501_21220 [Nocardia otitidiscaviarum]|uniref:hypothetical protein n=1 Tax=Nocardia otitidiscaviarum TaxID=1823 RepID=UPI0004A6FE2A|nr:hypothetical protein [Nocardia otitidiscaviarum]MBF6135511.1 hypothetical protein [Nocardia otitidiscaviarum]MBF6180849.1 hypothetical protein [Nocardia otitidiscaviarum]MBF6487328.1 hypothetical protein [Nocardia otitidiscaviarum]
MTRTIPTRARPDEHVLIDNVDGSRLALLLMGVIGLAWTLTASDADAHGWMVAGLAVTALAVVTGLGTAIERRRHRGSRKR